MRRFQHVSSPSLRHSPLRSLRAAHVARLERAKVAASAVLLSVAIVGCDSASSRDNDEGTGARAAAGGAGGAASGGAGAGGDDSVIWTPGAGGGGGAGQGQGGSCAGEVKEAERLPLDMYIMLDRSLSMNEETVTAGVTKWSAVTQALLGFANDAQSAGLGVGLQYFPANPSCGSDSDCPSSYCYLNTCNNTATPQPCQTDSDCPAMATGSCVPLGECGAETCTNVSGSCGASGACVQKTSSVCVEADICLDSHYSTPAVAIASLPGSVTALTGSLNAVAPAPLPYGFTPTGPALRGSMDYTKIWAAANPTHKVIAVLVTDGVPTLCAPTGSSAVAAISAIGLNEDPPVETFTIGVFAPNDVQGKANVAAIADSGGGQAFVVDPNANVSQQFIDALNTIRGNALECEFDVPAPPAGELLDYSKVNVEFSDPAGNTTVLAYVGSESGCHPTSGGWYYDVDPVAAVPSKIIVCGANCDIFKETSGGKVEIRVGCQTITDVPK